jgi:hypothetical protein
MKTRREGGGVTLHLAPCTVYPLCPDAEADTISNIQSNQYPISKEVTRSPPRLPLDIGHSWDWTLDIEVGSSRRITRRRVTLRLAPLPLHQLGSGARNFAIPFTFRCFWTGGRAAEGTRLESV